MYQICACVKNNIQNMIYKIGIGLKTNSIPVVHISLTEILKMFQDFKSQQKNVRGTSFRKQFFEAWTGGIFLLDDTEAVTGGVQKTLFLKILQYSQ